MPSSAKKLAKMTDEERVLYMEQKMLMEAEAKKKKEELMNELLREKLIKEEKNTRNNLNKINYQWRSIMRDAKAKDLLRDIEIMSQTFERIIDRKDSVIKALVKDLHESEEQYYMAMRSNFQNIDNLVDLHTEELNTAKKKFQEMLEVIKLEFDKEREFIHERHAHEMDELMTIIYGMEKTFLDQETEANIDFLSLRDELTNKALEEKQQLKSALETKIGSMHKEHEKAMKDYLDFNEERQKNFDALKKKDEVSAMDIDTQMRKIQNLTDMINTLKAKINQNTSEAQEANNATKENRDMMNKHFHELKYQMKQMQDLMKRKLTKLTVQSNSSIECLRKKEEKVKLILRLSEMCRKLETEEEKILPFYASSLSHEEEEEIQQALFEKPGSELADAMKDYLSLENFWKRYNKVLLDKVSLDKEKHMLSTENAQLRLLLKQYLDGISVNDEVMSSANPLFIINNRTNVRMNMTENGYVERGQKIIIEAKDHLKNTIY